MVLFEKALGCPRCAPLMTFRGQLQGECSDPVPVEFTRASNLEWPGQCALLVYGSFLQVSDSSFGYSYEYQEENQAEVQRTWLHNLHLQYVGNSMGSPSTLVAINGVEPVDMWLTQVTFAGSPDRRSQGIISEFFGGRPLAPARLYLAGVHHMPPT